MKILKNNKIICENVLFANTVIKRLVGLLGRKSFNDIDGLLLSPCSQIHSIGMKFEFDALYLDNTYRIVALYEKIGKNRILPYNISVKTVLELPSGSIAKKNLEIGDVLKIFEE